MNHLARIAALLFITLQAMAATPPQSVDLDLSQTARAFRLQFAEGTTPLLRGNVKNAGSAYTVTGWTATLYLSATWDDTSVIAIPSTTTGATYFDFQMTGTHTSTNGTFTANIIATDGTATVEWQRGEVDIRQSPGTAGAGTITLSTPLSWSGYTYSNTGGGGPYRAGTNVVFTVNSDGSANINADASGGSGDITGVTVSGGLLTGGASSGSADVALSTNAVRAAVDTLARIAGQTIAPDRIEGDGVLYIIGTDGMVIHADASGLGSIEVSGITTTNSVDAATINATDSITIGGTNVLTDASQINGANITNGTAIAALNASNLSTGTVPDAVTAAKYRQPVIAWSYRDLTLQTTAGVGWTGYEILAGSRRFGLDAISAAASDDQLATMRSDWQPVPSTFGAFKSSEALRVTWVVNSAAGVTEIRGIRLTGKSSLTGTETILYTDTTTRDVVSSGVPVAVSIARSSFASTTVPAYIAVDVDFSVEDGEKAAVVAVEVLSE